MVMIMRHSVLTAPPPIVVPPSGFWQGLNTVWPTAATTGPRIALVSAPAGNVSGTVSGKRFSGQIVPANGTVIVDCEINVTGGSWGIDGDGKTFTVNYCRITAGGNRYQAIVGEATILGCDISGFEDGFRPQGGAWSIRRSYIHDLYINADAHNDGIQAFEGPGIIEENYIAARDTAAVMVQSFNNTVASAPGGVIVRHNWLGGADLPLRIEEECLGKGCQAYENVIKREASGYYDCPGADVFYGNIDSVTGAAI